MAIFPPESTHLKAYLHTFKQEHTLRRWPVLQAVLQPYFGRSICQKRCDNLNRSGGEPQQKDKCLKALYPFSVLDFSPLLSCCPDCAGCSQEIKQGQSLLALERQWHITCFKCRTCGCALTGEYISKWVA